MLIRLSLALLLSLLVAAPSHAQFARRMIEHKMMGSAFSAAACQADAARLCPGVGNDALPECLMRHKSYLSLPCAREMNKLERQLGQ